MSRLATGTSSSMQNISQAKLKTLPVLVPPLDLQTRYSEIVASARVIATTAETASALSASLMARLFGDAA
jgi:restriction endonuclease S subunit